MLLHLLKAGVYSRTHFGSLDQNAFLFRKTNLTKPSLDARVLVMRVYMTCIALLFAR